MARKLFVLPEQEGCNDHCWSGQFQNDPLILSGMNGAGEE
jgi:hypothetical protein